MAKPLTTEECRLLNAAIPAGELVESEEAGIAAAKKMIRLVAAARSDSGKAKTHTYTPRSEDAKAIVEKLEEGKLRDDQIASRLMVTPGQVKQTKRRWLKSRARLRNEKP